MPMISRNTVTENFYQRVQASPEKVGFQFKPNPMEGEAPGKWKTYTFKEFYEECRLISYGLINLGVSSADRVVLLSQTRVEWSLCDMAILGARAVTVPIYASSTAEDVAYICQHSEARIAIVEDEKQLRKLLDHKTENATSFPYLEKIILLEPRAMSVAGAYRVFPKAVLSIQALKELGRREEARDSARFNQNLLSARPDDLITICYTSGTTGVPKGVMLTHDNMASVMEDCASIFSKILDPDNEVVLSFLPFSHIFGRMESFLVYTLGWKQAFAESTEMLLKNCRDVKPTVLLGVPRVFEKAHEGILEFIETSASPQKEICKKAFEVGRRYYSALWRGVKPSLVDRVGYELGQNLVFKKIQAQFGGKLKFAVSGGAPLPRETAEFFQILGLPLLEGYGLTETSAPVCVNLPEEIRFGTVGRPLPEVALKIAEDGEILIKSRKVFKAYYKMPEETREVLDSEGWLHTGDIGKLDSGGYLILTDRKKDLIITSGGKNVAPQKIENLAKSQKYISEFVVQGDRRKYLTALITLDRDGMIRYANDHEILFSEYAELIKNPKIIAFVQGMVNQVNQQLASHETIKKFLILPQDFSIESEELTPSLKVRRSVIHRKYQSELDSLYKEGPSKTRS